jgi:hypothetical protein
VAICDMRGNVKSEPVEAVANLLDDPKTSHRRQSCWRPEPFALLHYGC